MTINTQGWIDAGDGSASMVQVATVTLEAAGPERDGLPAGLRVAIRVGRVTVYAILPDNGGARRA